MGIPGLLPALKDFTQTNAQIRHFHGQAIAVDTSSWLHKAVYSVADTYVISDEAGRVDQHCVRVASRYLLQRCHELLVHADVTKLYLVLDGQHRCPLKAVTHRERARKRDMALEQARKAPNKQAAYEKYKACIHISHAFTQAVLAQVRNDHMFRQKRIVLVQSPHEADAQLVQLAQAGHVQAIITEDSDVLVYAATAKSDVTVIYKFNRHTGACHTVRMSWLWSRDDDDDVGGINTNSSTDDHRRTRKSTDKAGQQQIWRTLQSRERAEPGAGRRLFVQACVLTGCDYAPNELPGVGLVKAFTLVTSNAYLPSDQRFVSVVRGRLSTRSLTTPYIHKLRQAESVFYYHPVRDPFTKQLAWITVNEPCAPAFPMDNLDILGNPDELRYLAMPDTTTTVSKEQDATKESHLQREATQPAADDYYLQEASGTKKPPLPVSIPCPAKPIPRAPVTNPYRKRPLVTSQSPNQKPRFKFNPFVQFRHTIEKENNRSTLIAPTHVAPPPPTFAPPVQLETDYSTHTKSDAPPHDSSVTAESSPPSQKPVAKSAMFTSQMDKVIKSDSGISAERDVLPDDDSSVTDFSESGPPSPGQSLKSAPLFSNAKDVTDNYSTSSTKRDVTQHDDSSETNLIKSGGPMLAPTVQSHNVPHTEEFIKCGPLAELGMSSATKSSPRDSSTSPFFVKSLPRRVTQEPVASQPSIDLTPSPFPEENKRTSVMDFYDEWMSPKNKESAPMDNDEVEIEESPSPVKKNKPIPPQGAMRFRLAGVGTSRPLGSTKAHPAKNPSTLRKKALQPKLVYRPPRSKTLLDHFRAQKDKEKR